MRSTMQRATNAMRRAAAVRLVRPLVETRRVNVLPGRALGSGPRAGNIDFTSEPSLRKAMRLARSLNHGRERVVF